MHALVLIVEPFCSLCKETWLRSSPFCCGGRPPTDFPFPDDVSMIQCCFMLPLYMPMSGKRQGSFLASGFLYPSMFSRVVLSYPLIPLPMCQSTIIRIQVCLWPSICTIISPHCMLLCKTPHIDRTAFARSCSLTDSFLLTIRMVSTFQLFYLFWACCTHRIKLIDTPVSSAIALSHSLKQPTLLINCMSLKSLSGNQFPAERLKE